MNRDYFSPAFGVTTIPGPRNNTMAPQKAQLKWFICSPLLIGERVVGSIQLFYRNVFPLSDDKIDLFEHLSQHVAIAIDNMLAYEELERLKGSLAEEKTYLEKKVEQLKDPQEIIYLSRGMEKILDQVRGVAATDTTVLLTRETGTGRLSAELPLTC